MKELIIRVGIGALDLSRSAADMVFVELASSIFQVLKENGIASNAKCTRDDNGDMVVVVPFDRAFVGNIEIMANRDFMEETLKHMEELADRMPIGEAHSGMQA